MPKHYTQNTPVGDVKPLQRTETQQTLTTAPYIHTADIIRVIKWLLVLFAYSWWAVVVTYFGLLAENAALPLQILSLPVIVASFALARLFQMAINRKAHGFALLFFSGLLVAGMLA